MKYDNFILSHPLILHVKHNLIESQHLLHHIKCNLNRYSWAIISIQRIGSKRKWKQIKKEGGGLFLIITFKN